MGSRICQVWAIRKDRLGRIKHRLRYRHAKHECVRTRFFAQEHPYDHKCRCGLEWPKQDTDND